MTSVVYRGELLLTHEEAVDYNKNLERTCLEIHGLENGYVPWRFCAIDQSIRTHTPSSLSLATALRELDATVDPLTIINQPINRRSSYKVDASPARSLPSPSPPPVEVKEEPKPVKKVEEKIVYDTESDIYKLLHPSKEKLNNIPEWAKSIHKILKVICYMPQIKPFLKYFKPLEEEFDLSEKDSMEVDHHDGKSDKMDDFGFDVLSDDLNDILMDIDGIDPISRRESTHEIVNSENEAKLEKVDKVNDNLKIEPTSPLKDTSHQGGRNKSRVNKLGTTDSNEIMDFDTSSTNRGGESEESSKTKDVKSEDLNNNKLNDGTNGLGEVTVTNHMKGLTFLENNNLHVVNDANGEKLENEVKTEGMCDGDNNSKLVGVKDHDINERNKKSQVKFDDNMTLDSPSNIGNDENDTPNNMGLDDQTSSQEEDKGFEYILENILENKFENSSYVFSLLYSYLVKQFKLSSPGSHEWMCAQELSIRLNDLRIENQLKDAEKLHNYEEPQKPEPAITQPTEAPPHMEPKKQRTSMEDFEHELALINNVNDYSPTISLPEVKNITDEERMEFYENAMLLDQEFQLELFTVFEHAAVWKLVGNGEIELDDQNTDPKIYRGMIKWVKEKRNSTPNDIKETPLEMPPVGSEIVV